MELSAQQLKSIELLIAGKTFKEISTSINTPVETIRAWRSLEHYLKQLRWAYSIVHENNLLKLASKTEEVDEFLLAVITSEEEVTKTRLQAVNLFYSRTDKLKEAQLEQRLELLENKLES